MQLDLLSLKDGKEGVRMINKMTVMSGADGTLALIPHISDVASYDVYIIKNVIIVQHIVINLM